MTTQQDIQSIKLFREQLKPYEIEPWDSSESRPEEQLQQLVSSDESTTSTETPRAEELHPSQQISDRDRLPKETPDIRIAHFVDGSPRTVNIGFLLGANGIFYPVALSHVGACAVTYDNGRWRETGFVDRHLILVAYKNMGITINTGGKWKLEDPTDQINRPINVTDTVEMRGAAVRRARRRMANSEKDLVQKLAQDDPEKWIALDGTLFEIEGYSDSELKDFQVIGISKSFTLDPIVMASNNRTQRRLGYLMDVLTNLPIGSRSPVYKLTPHMGQPSKYTYMWFVRIHEARQSPVSGVVKVELPPSECYSSDGDVRARTIDALSHTIFRLRYPYLYDNRRGESFLYPIYVAEALIKGKLDSAEKIRGIWKSSQY